jgi:hypothetical protein
MVQVPEAAWEEGCVVSLEDRGKALENSEPATRSERNY